MSLSPALCALLALAAALLGVPRVALAPAPAVRVLALLAAVAYVPALDDPLAWPAAALVVGAAVFATPLACLLGAASAAVTALGLPPSGAPPSVTPILAALALAAGAASMDAETEARIRAGSDLAWPAALAGFGLCLALVLQGGGALLSWRVALEAGDQRVILPGAGLVAGSTLLVTLAGALAVAAHLLTSATPSGTVRRFGQRLLVLGCGLAVTSAGYVLYRGMQVKEMLAAGSFGLGAVFLGTGALLAGVLLLLRRPASGDAEPWRQRAALEAWIAAGLAGASAGAAGLEGWLHGASYATAATAAAASAALLGLATLEPTRLSLLRKGLMLVALVFVWRPW